MNTKRSPEWSHDDIVLFKEMYVKYGVQHCADHFNRSRNTVIRKAKECGVQYGNVKPHFQRENFEPIVKSAKNVLDVVRLLGLKAAGGNHKIINQYIQKYGIDTSHFQIHDKDRFANLGKMNARPLEEVMVENSSYSRSCLKERLYKTGIKKRECEDCGQGEIWRGKRIGLILDHINGVNNDHRRENLRILCPNCAAGLETHCGRNNALRRPDKLCPDCNKKISPRSNWCIKCVKSHYDTSYRKPDNKRCPDCTKEIRATSDHCRTCSKKHYGPEGHMKRRKVKERPSREQLLEDIATLNYVGTGKKYGVSDNAIRKWASSSAST